MALSTITSKITSLRKDENDNVIQGGSKIVDILEVALTSGAFATVTLASGVACKSFYAKTRSGNNWYLSDNGTTYCTIEGAISMDLVAYNQETLFYAKSTDATDTLEVILLD